HQVHHAGHDGHHPASDRSAVAGKTARGAQVAPTNDRRGQVMESRPRHAIVYALSAIVALGLMVPLRASTTDIATLKRIASRVENGTGVISIEASDPVP